MNSVCGSCLKGDCGFKCGACKEACYCSVECQRIDWQEHKTECGKTFGSAKRREYLLSCLAQSVIDNPEDWSDMVRKELPADAVGVTMTVESPYQMRLALQTRPHYVYVYDWKLITPLKTKPLPDEFVLEIKLGSPDGAFSSVSIIMPKK